MTIDLHLDAQAADAPAAIAQAATAALADRREPPRLRVALDGDALPEPLIGSLIEALRRLRDVGGAIAVVGESSAVRDALRLHGLDRIFAFPLDPDGDGRPRRRWFPFVRTAVALAAVVLAGAFGAPATAQPTETDPAAIVEHIVARNPTLSSFQGRMHLDVRMTSFPWWREQLHATTYFKRPSNYEVVFDRVPSYARGFEKLYADVGDPSEWQKRFTISYEGESDVDGKRVIALRLVQKVRGQIDHETAFVDPNTWTVVQLRYDYYNGGQITLHQEFRAIGGYLLLAAQRADIHIPYVRAVARGTYDDYHTNVAIDDAVFQRAKNQ